mmetsp:Transcript_14844/g.25872  ORF Transcript_14844/g.25872 Transcript_14844/m.25872 type:complete len:617 (+) Transcript_14844:603-2453(+)|eukprot:CAMPEP_0171497770 /NCGR_PEP_ID=MMETSP0958-20121227/7461_1 /TAXON_ID=87120 /ORGANISM="Aurantiochytrium limacinum, Strain ATCCMYA-1381" /LENGTH=616 /DNA_ID=CAMNT_0012032059 /DNA_START=644 /DNA_END=2494 /DNA_ORIENTATION=+
MSHPRQGGEKLDDAAAAAADIGDGLLIDGDDDLLDYFLGNEGGADGIDLDLKGLPPLSMDEVNDGMAGLLREGPGGMPGASAFDSSYMAPYGGSEHNISDQYGASMHPQHPQQHLSPASQAQQRHQQPASSSVGWSNPQSTWNPSPQPPQPAGYAAVAAPMSTGSSAPTGPGSVMGGMSSANTMPPNGAYKANQPPGSRGANPTLMGAVTGPGSVAPRPTGPRNPIKEEGRGNLKVPTGARGASASATASATATRNLSGAASSSSSNVPGPSVTSSAANPSPVPSSSGIGGVSSDPGSDAKPGSTEEEQERHRRRLERNRESARLSRRRKKENLELLENKVSRLTADLDELRRRHLEEANVALQERKLGLLRDLQTRMAQGSVGGDALRSQLLNIMRETGPCSNERMAMLEHHYKHLFNLILPPYTKFLLWMMNQGEGFFQDSNQPGGVKQNPMDQDGAPGRGRKADTRALWSLICAELSLSQEQQEKLRVNYKTQDKAQTRDERERLSLCTMYLEKLRSNIATRTKAVETHTQTLFNILSPEQAVKYVNWIENNRAALDACGVSDSIIFDQFLQGGAQSASSVVNEPRFAMAREVLLKPDEEMTLEDLNHLLAIL